jgi:peptidoglycan hydrolase-like protein with peptidoglycan-binding domain
LTRLAIRCRIVGLNWPLERQGSVGENVRSVQYLLDAQGATLAVDGIFGPLTAAAVSAFQSGNGLGVDGKVGNQTWPVLIASVSTGSSGDAVRAVQSQILSRTGFFTIDGIFGPETAAAVRYFQGDIGLAVDGIVGPHTWNAFTSGYLTSQGGQAASAMYDAWTHADQSTARRNAAPQAVSMLFARTWHVSDGWVFDKCDAAAGTFYCTWDRPGGKLIFQGNDNTGEPFYFVENVTFEP